MWLLVFLAAVFAQEPAAGLKATIRISLVKLEAPAVRDAEKTPPFGNFGPLLTQLLTPELTESVLVASGERAEQQLLVLKASGVKLALDDFGTGYASLAYLQRLPVDVVKIDRSFTAKIDSGADDLALLQGIVGLGKALGLHLVAEGIERDAQQGIVQGLGCHGAQGFFFGRPAAADVATDALAHA